MNTTKQTKNNKKMKTKDLIYAGAFGAVYLVLMLIIVMGSSMISPVLYLAAPFTVGLICATVYMIYVIKLHKFGAALILGILFALIACSSNLYSAIFALATTLVAELVIYLGKYKSKRMYLLSFVVFNLNMAAPTMMLLYNRDKFLSLTAGYRGGEHAQHLAEITPNWIWYAILGGAVLGGIIGVFIAKNLIKKHFVKAGVI